MSRKLFCLLLINFIICFQIGCSSINTIENDEIKEIEYESNEIAINAPVIADANETNNGNSQNIMSFEERQNDNANEGIIDTSLDGNLTCDSIEPETVDSQGTIIFNYLKTCPSGTKYGFYDIDEDGVMELLTAENDNHVDEVTIFSYNEETQELLKMGSFGSWGSLTYYPGGYILSEHLGQGMEEIILYKIADGEAAIVHEFWNNSGTLDEKYEYKVDGKQVSEKDYQEIYNQYISDEGINVGYSDFSDIKDYFVILKEE